MLRVVFGGGLKRGGARCSAAAFAAASPAASSGRRATTPLFLTSVSASSRCFFSSSSKDEGEAEQNTLKDMDMNTKATGFGGTFAMAEKLAEAQERMTPIDEVPVAAAVTESESPCEDCSSHHTPATEEATTTCKYVTPAPPDAVAPNLSRPLPGTTLNPTKRDSIEQLLVKSTIDSIKSSSANLSTPKGASHRGIQRLLDYNKQWAAEVSRFNPSYFADLATEQKPEYFWIGCSDSRVPANEIVGLHSGDVFVHRNIGNIFSLSDLNCLSALQFAVDSLKVEHVIVAGHYKCGGVTAALQGIKLGLTEHWIMQVTDIKNRWWHRISSEVPECDHLNILCELNVLEQISHVVSCCIIQRRWDELNQIDMSASEMDEHVHVCDSFARRNAIYGDAHTALTAKVYSKVQRPVDVEVHGWCYNLDDGMLRPLLCLTRHCNVQREVLNAREAIFIRYSGR